MLSIEQNLFAFMGALLKEENDYNQKIVYINRI